MQLTLTGEPADLAAFCQAVGRRTEERVTLYQTPKTVLDYIEAAKTNTSIPPIRKPPKERTAMLEAIFADYLAAGMDAKTIKEHLLSEHDISMTGHQICGWMGRMRQKGCQRPKDAAKAGLEGNCSSERKEAAKVTTSNPVDAQIWAWHEGGDLDIDISQRLRRQGVNMKPAEVAKVIRELKAEGYP